MNPDAIDQQLLQIVVGNAPNTIAEVIVTMQKIDGLLPAQDGLKWFNLLYLMVTNSVENNPPSSGWGDAAWLTKLDVMFAALYFEAIANFITPTSNVSVPSSWSALFEARYKAGIDRIQFAIAGMNAHINHDLALALLQTDAALSIEPSLTSVQHEDFEKVNSLLETVLPSALQTLSAGILGQAAQDTGKVGQMLAFWNVRAARDLAWGFADHLRNLTGPAKQFALDSQDQITGALGRSLLVPV